MAAPSAPVPARRRPLFPSLAPAAARCCAWAVATRRSSHIRPPRPARLGSGSGPVCPGLPHISGLLLVRKFLAEPDTRARAGSRSTWTVTAARPSAAGVTTGLREYPADVEAILGTRS
jgi:hypothetical protein